MKIFFIISLLIIGSYFLPGKNFSKIEKYVRDALAFKSTWVTMNYHFLSATGKGFDVFIKDQYLILLNINRRFSTKHHWFQENYIIVSSEKEYDQNIVELFSNFVVANEVINTKSGVKISGVMYTKTIFKKDFTRFGTVNINVSLVDKWPAGNSR